MTLSLQPAPAPFRTVDIDGVPIHDATFDEAVSTIVRWAHDESGGYVYTPNVDDIVKARRLPEFRSALLGARLRVPDGMGIVYGSRILGRPLRGTVTGRRLPEAIGRALAADSLSIGMFGGAPGVADEAARTLHAAGVRVAAALAPPMGFVIGSEIDADLTRRLAASGGRVVFVSLGAPRQALWMARHASELPGVVLVGVGGAVDVLAGRLPVPPAWMTKIGMEWLFRLTHEPGRLARRYLVDDPRFFWWMIAARLRRSVRRG